MTTLTTKISELNRALIKRFELIPNVSDFYTEKYGIHEYAAIYGIEKILRRTYAEKLVAGGPNKYLIRQYQRLTYYAVNGELEKFNFISTIILRKSISFRILALNRVMKDWFSMRIRDLRRIWRSLSYICKTESSDLKFKRVWIDKKPGDYARPLGVPTPAWRCYSYMRLDHMERYLKGNKYLETWQHGGRSGRGVLSCYKDLIPKLKNSNTIYEFDIRGFFDNIKHSQIKEVFERSLGPKVSHWVGKILESKPTSYVLPPIEVDKAALKYQAIKDMEFEEDWGVMTPTAEDYGFKYVDYNKAAFEGLTADQATNLVSFEEEAEWDMIMAKNSKPIDIRGSYKSLMEDQPITRRYGNSLSEIRMEEINEKARAEGRDNWKNLGQPGRGVPQGLGTSPLVSTLMTDVTLHELGSKGNLIMYMDDGILFANSGAEMEKVVEKLKEKLSILGLEIAPEKSKYVKEDNQWKDSLRFLGLRYLPGEDTITSETRSGTKIKFPVTGKWPDIKDLMNSNGINNVSMMRKKFDRLINTQAYEAGLEHGFLGCLIAGSQYKDSLTLIERKEKVREGQGHAWANITASQGFVWKYQDLYNHTECLTNISSIACERFANFHRKDLKFYIPRNSIRRNRKERVHNVR
jgi:retron-type reverse transcriptase